MAGRGVRVWESLCGGGSGGAGRPGRGSGLITLPVAGWGKARSACRVRGGGERSGFRRFGVGCSGRLGDALAGFPAGAGMRRSVGKRCVALSLWRWVGR